MFICSLLRYHNYVIITLLYSTHSSTLARCPILINPPNGIVGVTGNSPGDTANYICDPDFELVGNSTRVCGDDGQWSGEAPMCIRK